MKAQSELRGILISMLLISSVLTAGFQFYVGLANEYGVSFTDESDLNKTSQLEEIANDLKTTSDDIQETNIGGFSVLIGSLSALNTLKNSVGLATDFIGQVGVKLGIPTYITGTLITILIIIGFLSFVGIVWSKIKP